jgi:hypothetical protein
MMPSRDMHTPRFVGSRRARRWMSRYFQARRMHQGDRGNLYSEIAANPVQGSSTVLGSHEGEGGAWRLLIVSFDSRTTGYPTSRQPHPRLGTADRTVDACFSLRVERLYQLPQKRSLALVSFLQDLAVAEIADALHSRDFRSPAIFEFFNTIGAMRPFQRSPMRCSASS